MSQPLPNFFIVGTGKAGTTSLHSYLRQHPQIYMSPVKEPGYFATEIRAENLSEPLRRHLAVQSRELPKILNDGAPFNPYGWIAGDWQDYERLFQGVNGEKAIGEATAAYLWSATAAANIHARLPEARIIMILRDPAERAFSQYLHQLSVGLTGATFREHLEQCARAGRKKLSHLYPFLEIGLYCEQVKRFLDLFPREQIRIYWYEEAWRQPANLLADVFRFLGCGPAFQPDLSRKASAARPAIVAPPFPEKFGLWYPLKALSRRLVLLFASCVPARPLSGHGPDDRRYLIDYYRDDIQRLAALLDRDLSAWLR